MFDPRERDNRSGILDRPTRRDNRGDRIGATNSAPIANKSRSNLDSAEAMELHRRLMGHYLRELDAMVDKIERTERGRVAVQDGRGSGDPAHRLHNNDAHW